jgi:ATP-dependent DNA helicase RecQ
VKNKIQNILKQYWGYDSFRDLQEEIILSVLDNKNTLALMPTGGGKSICFQVPVLAQEGIGIVISPLIALMKDQVENLNKRGIKAIAIYSGMTAREIDVALDNCVYGNVKFLYVSPERTTTIIFRERLKKMKVSLIAVDEAHCISQWGYDFRPSYLKITEIKEFVDNSVPFLAVTATANNRVKNDILDKLNFNSENIFKQSFERDNLGYLVLPEENKEERLLKILNTAKSSAIVYVNTRKKTQDISSFLRMKGISADYYHGGLTQQIRSDKQHNWIENKSLVIVATNAFGMGIDKPDVRVVVHMDIPSSPEAYFQEAGRAGRDGKKSFATLLYKPSDKINLEKTHALEFPEKTYIKSVYNSLGNYFQLAIGAGLNTSYVFNIGDFGKRYEMKPILVYNAIKILSLNGYLELSEAIYHPTTLKVLLNSESLYNFQVKNKKYEIVIRNILRLYTDIFDNYKRIDVTRLAQKCGSNYKVVNTLLLRLKKLEVVDYVEAHDSPIMTYIRERVHDDRLVLSPESYRERKKIKEEQMNFMIRYCESQDICRNRLLLSYFDEKSFKDCGICDVCIERKKKSLNNAGFKEISAKIEGLLLSEDYSITSLLKVLTYSEKEIIKTTQWLMDNKKIFVTKEQKFSIKKTKK